MPNEFHLNKDFFFSFLFSCGVASVAPGLVELLPWRQSLWGCFNGASVVGLLPWRQCLWSCFRGASACGVASVAPVFVGFHWTFMASDHLTLRTLRWIFHYMSQYYILIQIYFSRDGIETWIWVTIRQIIWVTVNQIISIHFKCSVRHQWIFGGGLVVGDWCNIHLRAVLELTQSGRPPKLDPKNSVSH